mmetsp:Transcript_33343/g.74632  ORF Transcript_33343/g.74632 Transcript_33343/m.74632 type:complete len:287 (-) Transcript_33343:66-926(-)
MQVRYTHFHLHLHRRIVDDRRGDLRAQEPAGLCRCRGAEHQAGRPGPRRRPRAGAENRRWLALVWWSITLQHQTDAGAGVVAGGTAGVVASRPARWAASRTRPPSVRRRQGNQADSYRGAAALWPDVGLEALVDPPNVDRSEAELPELRGPVGLPEARRAGGGARRDEGPSDPRATGLRGAAEAGSVLVGRRRRHSLARTQLCRVLGGGCAAGPASDPGVGIQTQAVLRARLAIRRGQVEMHRVPAHQDGGVDGRSEDRVQVHGRQGQLMLGLALQYLKSKPRAHV